MAFEDRITASFRNIAFELDTTSGTSGRRAIAHAYPKRNNGYAEDNGAIFKQERIEGRIVGDDYVARFITLLNALNEPGAGTLKHPWFGDVQIQVGSVSHKLDLKEDGLATFSFEALNAGENLFPSSTVDTASGMEDSADEARETVEDGFSAAVLAAEKGTTEAAGLGELFDQALEDLEEFTRSIPSLSSELGDWVQRLESAKADVSDLLATPGDLAAQFMGLLEDVKDIVTDPIQAISVYDGLINRWDGLRAEYAVRGGLGRSITVEDGVASSVGVASDTDTVDSQDSNIIAFNALLTESSLIEKASAIANSDFTTFDDIDTIDGLSGVGCQSIVTANQLTVMGNALASALYDAAESAVERGASDVWRTLRVLRSSVLEDTRLRAQQLPSLSTVTPSITMPVALLAWQQTGDTEDRANIIRRNGLAHPSFILAGQEVELING